MSTTDYIPHTDDGFRTWAVYYATNISAGPGTYQLTAAQAASIQSVVDDFVAKLLIADNELTRNKQTVADKEDAKAIAISLCRNYAILIKENSGISDGDKLAIGVRPINPNRDPINVPMTSPIVTILGNTPGSQTLQFRDPTEPDSKAKPFGATELQLFLAITDSDDPAPLDTARFHSKVTRNPIAVEFNQADDGKMATYYARWASARGEFGPWSLPAAMRIAA